MKTELERFADELEKLYGDSCRSTRPPYRPEIFDDLLNAARRAIKSPLSAPAPKSPEDDAELDGEWKWGRGGMPPSPFGPNGIYSLSGGDLLVDGHGSLGKAEQFRDILRQPNHGGFVRVDDQTPSAPSSGYDKTIGAHVGRNEGGDAKGEVVENLIYRNGDFHTEFKSKFSGGQWFYKSNNQPDWIPSTESAIIASVIEGRSLVPADPSEQSPEQPAPAEGPKVVEGMVYRLKDDIWPDSRWRRMDGVWQCRQFQTESWSSGYVTPKICEDMVRDEKLIPAPEQEKPAESPLIAEPLKPSGDSNQLAKEKERRVYYQNIVYSICNLIDGWRADGSRIVCGKVDEPHDDLQRAVKEMILARANPQTAALLEAARNAVKFGHEPPEYYAELAAAISAFEGYDTAPKDEHRIKQRQSRKGKQ